MYIKIFRVQKLKMDEIWKCIAFLKKLSTQHNSYPSSEPFQKKALKYKEIQ